MAIKLSRKRENRKPVPRNFTVSDHTSRLNSTNLFPFTFAKILQRVEVHKHNRARTLIRKQRPVDLHASLVLSLSLSFPLLGGRDPFTRRRVATYYRGTHSPMLLLLNGLGLYRCFLRSLKAFVSFIRVQCCVDPAYHLQYFSVNFLL